MLRPMVVDRACICTYDRRSEDIEGVRIRSGNSSSSSCRGSGNISAKRIGG